MKLRMLDKLLGRLGQTGAVRRLPREVTGRGLPHRLPVHSAVGFVAAILLCLMGCQKRPAAFEYRSTPVEGWEPGDTLHFHLDTLQAAGQFRLELGVRTATAFPYPYQSLWIVARQHFHQPESVCTDTIEIQLADRRGDTSGRGITLHQFTHYWKTIRLSQGQSADIHINHLMRSEMLPGVESVGLRIEEEY